MRTLNWRWLGRQLKLVGLGLLVLYAVGVGGTLNGLVKVPLRALTLGLLVVLSAGTADIPIAQEAAVTARVYGSKTTTLFDVGVSGIHRLFDHHQLLNIARVIVVVAGMEGALASVVAGLVNSPVIAVPTSVGYGASFGGVAALLTMLNSCAGGVAVVNIDNGYSAGCIAHLINSPGCLENGQKEADMPTS